MSERQFGISSDIYCTSVNTNKVNCQEIVSNSIEVNSVDLPVGGQYKIGGVHVLSTPVQASSVALTPGAQPSGQQSGACAVGPVAGQTNQGQDSVALGNGAGQTNQGQDSVAIGSVAGNISQGSGSVAVGIEAGETSQGANCVAVGNGAGNTGQSGFSVAVGYHSCFSGCGGYNVAVGSNSCANNVIGEYNICIGDSSSVNAGVNSSIVIGAGAVATASNQFVIASAAHPIPTTPLGGPLGLYLPITLNGVDYKLALYAP